MKDKINYLTNKKISIVVVCYKDEFNIEALYKRLTTVIPKVTPNYEIIYVNDCSPDNSEIILRTLASKDSKLVVINHSRNFGNQAAFTSGMVQSTGDAVVLMDGDLQDPPEMIPEFIKKWIEGYKIVYGTRKNREKSLGRIKQFVYHSFYVIFNKMSYIKMPLDAGDFSIMDRIVVDHLNSMPEKDRYIRGLRAWVGYNSISLPYVRSERYDKRHSAAMRGFISPLRWARKAIFSFSYTPLEWITYLAFSTIFISIIGMVYFFIAHFIFKDPPGFATIILAILFFSAIQLLSISIIGEYLGRIFEEVKSRPRYLIKDIINNTRKEKLEEIHYKLDKQ